MKHTKVSSTEKKKNSSHRVKKKKISALHVRKKILHLLKSPTPRHFSDGPSLIGQYEPSHARTLMAFFTANKKNLGGSCVLI